MRTGKPKHLQLRSHLHVHLFFTHSSVQSRAVSLKQLPLPLSFLPQLLLQQLQHVSVRLSEPVDPYHAAGELPPVRSWLTGGSGALSPPLSLLHRRRSSSSCRRSGRLNPTPSHRCTAVRFGSVQFSQPSRSSRQGTHWLLQRLCSQKLLTCCRAWHCSGCTGGFCTSNTEPAVRTHKQPEVRVKLHRKEGRGTERTWEADLP